MPKKTFPQDVERIGAILRKRISPVNIVVLRSGDQRFFVVADSFEITENEWDIFESPIEFRSHFRAKQCCDYKRDC